MNPDATEELIAGRFKRTLHTTFISLRTRNFRLYFTGQMISNTGNWLTNVALTLLVLKISGSGFAVGLVAACQFGPILFLSAYAGALADRYDKRKFLIVTQCLEMGQSIGLAILAFMPHPPLVALYALAILGGTFLAFDNPLRRSFVGEMVPKKDVPNAVVLYSLIVNTSRIFGPALAGLLVITAGYGWCFAIDAASYIAVLISLFKMRPSELHKLPPKARARGEIRAGLRYVRNAPVLWVSFVMLMVIQLLSYNFNVTIPLFVTKSLHRSGGTFTVLYSIFSLGAVVSGLIVAHRSFVKIQHAIYGAIGLGITMLLLSLTPGIVTAVPMIFLIGMASILYLTATTAIAQTETDPAMHGRVLALQTVVFGGGTFIGGPILGALADHFGGRSPMVLGGIVALIAASFGLFANKRYVQRQLSTATEA